MVHESSTYRPEPDSRVPLRRASSTALRIAATPVRLAVATDCELVTTGVKAMLAEYQDDVRLIDTGAYVPGSPFVDVVLVDPTSRVRGSHGIETLLEAKEKVAIFSWCVEREVVDAALRQGVSGYLFKGLSARDLTAALVAIRDGETVINLGAAGSQHEERSVIEQLELSPREAQVMGMIAQGMTNLEIAASTYLSVNTVKTYIRSGYRKVGVSRRAEAVIWGIKHGLNPECAVSPYQQNRHTEHAAE